ncbi:MAG: AEC family transporter [Lachnospiraceae bacterium]|nr:AEC family transporter [Lachnospiraceae bacterium]
MESFLVAVNKLSVLALLVFFGWIIQKKHLVAESFVDNIINYLIKFAMPITIISSLQVDFSKEMLINGGVLIIAYALTLIVNIIIGYISSGFLKITRFRRGVWIYDFMLSNAVYVGIPVLLAIFGQGIMFYATIINLISNLFTFTIGAYISASFGVEGMGETNFVKLLLTPLNASIVIGILLMLLRIKLPGIIGNSFGYIADTAVPMSMIYIGMVLGKDSVKSFLGDKQAYLLSAIRLLVLPLAAYVIFSFILKDKEILGTIVVTLAMPAPAMGAVFAGQFGADKEFASKVVFLTTLFCIVTIPFVSMLFT